MGHPRAAAPCVQTAGLVGVTEFPGDGEGQILSPAYMTGGDAPTVHAASGGFCRELRVGTLSRYLSFHAWAAVAQADTEKRLRGSLAPETSQEVKRAPQLVDALSAHSKLEEARS